MNAPTSPLPAATPRAADASWQAIDLLSDVHLAPSLPRTFETWARHMLDTPAQAVLILGDLFEFWPGDDAVQLGFERRCADVLAAAAERRHVGLMVGNRDFLIRPKLLQGLGVEAMADPTLLCAFGRRWLLTHGDALCLSDVDYQKFRQWARTPATQAEFLARPLAERIQFGAKVRQASRAGREHGPATDDWGDVDIEAAVASLQAAGAPCLVHGHTHRPGDAALAPGFRRQVLSDWDLDGMPPRAEVLRLSAAVDTRLPPEGTGVGR